MTTCCLNITKGKQRKSGEKDFLAAQMTDIVRTTESCIWKTYGGSKNAYASGLHTIQNRNQMNKRPYVGLCSVKKGIRNRTGAQMRQIDGMEENLTRINGTAGNNHDGEKEK